MKYFRLAVLCLAAAASSAHADAQATYQWMLSHQIVASAQLQNGAGVVVAGANFFSGDATSQQALCATLLSYLQLQNSTVQQFSLVDGNGNPIGVYSNGALMLTTQ